MDEVLKGLIEQSPQAVGLITIVIVFLRHIHSSDKAREADQERCHNAHAANVAKMGEVIDRNSEALGAASVHLAKGKEV